jgi:hypothetical protein
LPEYSFNPNIFLPYNVDLTAIDITYALFFCGVGKPGSAPFSFFNSISKPHIFNSSFTIDSSDIL